MGHATDPRMLVAHKTHRCDWCDQRIMPGEKYKRYRWYDGGDASTVKLHQECSEACAEAALEYRPYQFEFSPGEHARGCTCDHDPDCQQPFCSARRRICQAAARAGDIFKRFEARCL